MLGFHGLFWIIVWIILFMVGWVFLVFFSHLFGLVQDPRSDGLKHLLELIPQVPSLQYMLLENVQGNPELHWTNITIHHRFYIFLMFSTFVRIAYYLIYLSRLQRLCLQFTFNFPYNFRLKEQFYPGKDTIVKWQIYNLPTTKYL